MSRTRLRQLEQLQNSQTYADRLNQGDGSGSSTEGQPGNTIGSTAAVVSITSPDTIVVSGNFTSGVGYGANAGDRIAISGGLNDGTSATISSLSYSSGPNQTTFVVINPTAALVTEALPISVTATVTVDPNKTLEKDLNHIRTQLRKLTNVDGYWYGNPTNLPVNMFSSQTSSPVAAGSPIDVGGNYDAGEPYELNAYLNGDLLQPSVISGHAISVQYDYQEVDSSGSLVQAGEVGRKIKMNFDIVAGDILQFVWSK